MVARLTLESVKLLYEKHGAALAAYACSRGLDFASAEDMVHQVFVKLLEGRPSSSIELSSAYLFRAVRNASLNLRRDRRREAVLDADEIWFSHGSANCEEILSVQSALCELPEEQREAVFLKIWGGLTFEEIADATDTSLNTVASRYRYALERLSKVLEETARDLHEKG